MSKKATPRKCFMRQGTEPKPRWTKLTGSKRWACSKFCLHHYLAGSDLT